jgi:tRNA 5-methylaminomethyl-2-thiouridine biosynthesis bifunctional protein
MSNTHIQWNDQGLPRSVAFDDKYFCERNGLLEARHVFCDGNDLPSRFQNAGERVFTIAETGFGTGLNFLCTWKLWKTHAPANARLHFVSIEKFPFSPEDLTRSMKLWPDLQILGSRFIEEYRPEVGTAQEIDLEKNVRLTLIFDDVSLALSRMKDRSILADAWFLHGFDPKKNPEMWAPEVFASIADLSLQGATLATFTSAGAVRRGLTQAGFQMHRAPGFGGKRHMLKGRFFTIKSHN